MNRYKRTKRWEVENSKGMEDAEFDTSGMNERTVWTIFSKKEHGYYLPPNDEEARIALAGIFNANDKKIVETLVAAKKVRNGPRTERAKAGAQ